MRLFVAVNIPDELKTGITEIQEHLKHSIESVKWVAADKLHITLKFLGEVQKDYVAEITEAIEESTKPFKPFDVSFSVSGDFPNDAHPRVVWVDIDGGRETLAKLAQAIEDKLLSLGLGIAKETRPFSPHLTLGRVRAEHGVGTITKRQLVPSPRKVGSFTVKSIDIMQSNLDPKGAEYICLKSISIS